MQEETKELTRNFESVPGSGVVYNVVDYLLGWARKYSIWPIHFVTGCCSPEFMQCSGSEYDMERLGVLPFASVRQCDCIMVVGVVSRKMAIRVKYLYEQMGEPISALCLDKTDMPQFPDSTTYIIMIFFV